MIEAFEAHMAGMGLLDSRSDMATIDDGSSVIDADQMSECTNNVVITGRLNGGRRIDYVSKNDRGRCNAQGETQWLMISAVGDIQMLQEKEIENANEYVAALAAHSCYWTEKDLSLFLARQIIISETEQEADIEWELHSK